MAVETDHTIADLLVLCGEIKYPFPQYSSWLLSHIADNHKDKLLPYYSQIIDAFLDCPDPSAQRNLGNVLIKFQRTTHREGELLDKLFYFLTDPETKVAMKVYAMYLITDFLKDYPELKGEFQSIIEAGMQYESAAYQSAARKTLKILSNI